MRTSQQQQLVPDRCTSGGAEAGSRAAGGGKVKAEKASSVGGGTAAVDYYAHRVGPYTTPQQYMLNKRAKYAGTAAPAPAGPAEVLNPVMLILVLVLASLVLVLVLVLVGLVRALVLVLAGPVLGKSYSLI